MRQAGGITAENAAWEAQSVIGAPNHVEVMVGEEEVQVSSWKAATLEQNDRALPLGECSLWRLLQEQDKEGTGSSLQRAGLDQPVHVLKKKCSMSWVARLLHLARFDWFLPAKCVSSGNIS